MVVPQSTQRCDGDEITPSSLGLLESNTRTIPPCQRHSHPVLSPAEAEQPYPRERQKGRVFDYQENGPDQTPGSSPASRRKERPGLPRKQGSFK